MDEPLVLQSKKQAQNYIQNNNILFCNIFDMFLQTINQNNNYKTSLTTCNIIHDIFGNTSK